jgi:hypothetical protein
MVPGFYLECFFDTVSLRLTKHKYKIRHECATQQLQCDYTRNSRYVSAKNKQTN